MASTVHTSSSSSSCSLARMLEDQQLQAGSLTRFELVGIESQLQEAAREKVCAHTCAYTYVWMYICTYCTCVPVCLCVLTCVFMSMCVRILYKCVYNKHICMCEYKQVVLCDLLCVYMPGQAEVMTELEKRSAEVAMEKMEKDNLKRKIMEMEESLVGWGLLEWCDE